MIAELASTTGLPFTEARNHFEAQGARDALVELSGQLKTIAVGLTKLCNDLRWMASGPRTGLAEINLPDLQPGSSIMPGKVNPVLPEATLMVCAQVIGNDTAITVAGASGSFELNVMMPVLARNLLESIRLLSTSSVLLADRCIDGITANVDRMRTYAESSPSVVTPLNRYIGYENAAKVAKKALAEEKTIREVVVELGFVEKGDLTEQQLDDALDVASMTTPSARCAGSRQARSAAGGTISLRWLDQPAGGSVPVVALLEAPRSAGRAVAAPGCSRGPTGSGWPRCSPSPSRPRPS